MASDKPAALLRGRFLIGRWAAPRTPKYGILAHMRHVTAMIGAALCAAGTMVHAAVLDLNGSWEFRFEEGKAPAQTAGAAFAATDRMAVPGCYDMMPQWLCKRGTGLYRRTFTLDRAVDNAWLVVDGMGLVGHFQIDGRDLGTHPYPYARLELETGPLAAGTHTLFAALDNRFDWETLHLARPYYDFYLFGGFYHGVSLRFDNRTLFVRTRDYRAGTVEIEAVNFKDADFDATLVFDGTNAVQAAFRNARATVRVPHFSLWSPESPNLHTVALAHGAATPVAVRFGIREIKAADRRLWLNGRPLYLKGANRHESHPQFGAATPEALMVEDIQSLKALGGNFFRGCHYQQAQRFLDYCDEMGVLVWEESLGWGNGQDYTNGTFPPNEAEDAGFCEMQVRQTREMVRASFNHPSVIVYGFLNECGSQKASVKALVDRLAATVKAEDSGRLVTFACNNVDGDICSESVDLVSINAYPGTIPATPGTPAQLKAKVDARFTRAIARFRKLYPDKPIMVSESGCGGLYGMHDPNASINTEEYQEEYLRDILECLWANPDCSGFAIWQMNDGRTRERYCDKNCSPMFGGSIAGCFDQLRRPKRSVETVKAFFKAK